MNSANCLPGMVYLLALLLSGCGGHDSPPPQRSEAASLVRVEIAQTLIQSTDDPSLLIAQQKPFVIRAFFTVPEHDVPPAQFLVSLSNSTHPDAVLTQLNCPANFPPTFPSDPTAIQSGGASGVCVAKLSQADNGVWWAMPGLSMTFRAIDSHHNDVMTPVVKHVGAAVLAKNLTIPLCPRIIVDAQGASLDPASVSNVEDLNAALLAYFPFSKATYCPEAFMPLSVTTLAAYGAPSLANMTQAEIEPMPGPLLGALEAFRSARRDGYAGYIHMGLLVSSSHFVNPPTTDGRYSGTHGVTGRIGGLTAVLFVAPNFANGPLDYFQYHLIFLHELGHTLGLAHAPGCGAGGYDPQYPYDNGALPESASDSAVTPMGAPPGTVPTVPLRGTLGATNGFQLEPLSNLLSRSYAGIAARNQPNYVYQAGNSQLIGNGANEITIASFQPGNVKTTAVYDLMNYCSVYFYNKWISDYSYRRIAAFSQDRIQPDGSFADIAGQITFGGTPPPENTE